MKYNKSKSIDSLNILCIKHQIASNRECNMLININFLPFLTAVFILLKILYYICK